MDKKKKNLKNNDGISKQDVLVEIYENGILSQFCKHAVKPPLPLRGAQGCGVLTEATCSRWAGQDQFLFLLTTPILPTDAL